MWELSVAEQRYEAVRAVIADGGDPAARRPGDRKWKRWERGTAMELWQMDVVGGFLVVPAADTPRTPTPPGPPRAYPGSIKSWPRVPRQPRRRAMRSLLAMACSSVGDVPSERLIGGAL
jgi:hypothetical protein